MSNHALTVRLHVEPVESKGRVHVIIRLVLLVALGTIGAGRYFWLFYLALPALAALLVAHKGNERYLVEDVPTIVRVLRWVASAYAYLWLLTDATPSSEEGGPVELYVEPSGHPTPGSAMLRLLYSLPALIVLFVLSCVAWVLWIIGAIAILVVARLPGFIADFLGLTLRYLLRLIAYHLSVVDEYPSFAEAPIPRPA